MAWRAASVRFYSISLFVGFFSHKDFSQTVFKSSAQLPTALELGIRKTIFFNLKYYTLASYLLTGMRVEFVAIFGPNDA